MNESGNISRRRVPTFIAMLFGAIFTMLLLPAYGQQEVDPTWYDPSPSNVAVAHSSQPAAVAHKHAAKVRSVSSAQVAGKDRVKRTATKQRPS